MTEHPFGSAQDKRAILRLRSGQASNEHRASGCSVFPLLGARKPRLALLALCLCVAVAHPLRATTVTGTVKLPDGTPLNGTVEFVLSQPAQTLTPPALYVPEKVICPITNGAISVCIVTGNDVLSPAGTYYSVTLLDANNRVVAPAVNYTLSGASVDLSTLPVTTSATLVAPIGDITGNLSVTGNLTVGGSATYGASPQTFAHLSFTGLTVDPATVAAGSLFYRSDLDRLRARVAGLQLWDGAQYVDLSASANTLSFSGDLKVGGSSSGIDNNVYIVDGTKYTSLSEAIAGKVAVVADGGAVYLPPNLGVPQTLTVPVDLTALGVGSNMSLLGSGRYSSALTLGNGANSSMLVQGSASHVRMTVDGLWFRGNKTNQTAVNNCLDFGGSADWWGMIFDHGGVVDCKGSGFRLGATSPLFTGTDSYNRVMRSLFITNDGNGVEIVPPARVYGSISAQYEGNGENGLYLHPTANAPGITDVVGEGALSYGDWFESNTRYTFDAENWRGVRLRDPWAAGIEAFVFGRQTRSSTLEGGVFRQNPVYDAGFYNRIADLSCAQAMGFQRLNGVCPNRSKFPVKEEHYDPSIVADWDMSANGTSSWTAGAAATVTKTEYIGQTTGNRYLRLTCSTAPCEVTQDVTDSIGGSGYFTVLYTIGASSAGAVAGVQIRRSTDDAVMIDSGWLSAPQDSNQRPDYKWDAAVALTAGNWRVALRCNSTTVACLFTDVRLVKNYVPDGGFESGTAGWATLGTCTTSSVSAVQKFTGSQSLHLSDSDCAYYKDLNATLTVGDYYLLQGWVYTAGGAQLGSLGWGNINDGSSADGGIPAGYQFYDSTRKSGEWEFIQAVVRADGVRDKLMARFGIGQIGTEDIYFDDLAVIHLRRNPQHATDYFARLVNSGDVSTKTLTVTGGVTGDGGGFKHGRVTTGSIGASASAAVTLSWTTAFADANYTATCSVVEATAGTATLRLHHIESVAATGVTVRVVNDDTGVAHTGTLECLAIHD